MNINSGELDTGKHSSEVRAPYPVVMVDLRIANMMGFHTVWEAEDFQALNEKTKDWQIHQYVDGRWRRAETSEAVVPTGPVEGPAGQPGADAGPVVEEGPVPDIQVEVAVSSEEKPEIPSEEPEKVIIEEDLEEMQVEEKAPEVATTEVLEAENTLVSGPKEQTVGGPSPEVHLPQKPQEYVGAELAEEEVPAEGPMPDASPDMPEEELVGFLPGEAGTEAATEEEVESAPEDPGPEREMTLDELFEELVPRKKASGPAPEEGPPKAADKVISLGVNAGPEDVPAEVSPAKKEDPTAPGPAKAKKPRKRKPRKKK